MYKDHSLRFAVKRQSTKEVERLLSVGVNPLYGNNNDYPDCLTLAVLKNKTEVVKVLLRFYTAFRHYAFGHYESARLHSLENATRVALREETLPAFELLMPYLLQFIKLVHTNTFSSVINDAMNKWLGIAHRKRNKELCEVILKQKFPLEEEHFICALHWHNPWFIEQIIKRKDETTLVKNKVDRSIINAFDHIRNLDGRLRTECFAYFACHYEFKELYNHFFSPYAYRSLATPLHVFILIREQELTLQLYKKECLDVLFQAYGKLYLCEYLFRDVVNHIFKFLI